MGNLLTIYRRECASYFNSPIAYIAIVVYLTAMAFIFFVISAFFSSSNPDFRGYFENSLAFGFFSLLFIPSITMRLWSEERKQGTIELLMTLPLRTWEIVLGKFLAAYTIVCLAILLTLPVPIAISWVLPLDWSVVASGYLGIILVSAVYVSAGACVSALTENQIVAFLLAVVFSAIICFIGFPMVVTFINDYFFGTGYFFGNFGTFFHYQYFARGLINPVAIGYVVGMSGLFLVLNNFIVQGRKY